jgi:drug/metabolite transporter (DMT)-like permease
LSVFVALIAALCLGTGDFIGGLAARRTSPIVISTWINVVAMGVLAIVCVVVGPRLSSDQALGAVAGGITVGITITLIYAALAAGAMSLAAPLVACGAGLVPTLVAIGTGQPPSTPQGIGVAFALGGVVLITWRPQGESTPVARRAIALALLAALSSGIAVSITQLSSKDSVDAAIGVAGLSRPFAVLTCVAMLAVSKTRPSSPRTVTPMLLAGGFLEASGTLLLLIGSALGNTAVVAVVVSLYAIVTILLAQAVLRERIHIRQGFGILVSMVGVALLAVS